MTFTVPSTESPSAPSSFVAAALEFLTPLWVELLIFMLASFAYLVIAFAGKSTNFRKDAKLSHSQEHKQRPGKLERRVSAHAAGGLHASDKMAGQDASAKVAKKISAAGKEGKLDLAISAFKNLKREGSPQQLTSLVYNCVVDACVHCDKLDVARLYFAEAKAAGLADVVGYNTLMKGYLAKSDTEAVRRLLLEMFEHGLQPTHIAYHCLLNALVHAGQHQQTWRTVKQMQIAGLPPNAVTCSILLKTLTSRSYDSEVERVMKMVDNVPERTDEILFASMVEALIRIQRLDLLKERTNMHSGGIPISSAPMYGSMIKAHGQAHDMDSVWELWQEMTDREIVPTAITLGVMVEALVANQYVEDAWKLVQDIWKDEARKDSVNTVVYSTVLKGFAMSKQYDKVGKIYDEMRERGVPCNTITYNTMLNALARCGFVHRVPHILEDMQTADPPVEPDTVTYSTIVKAYCLAGEVDQAIRLKEEMRKGGKCMPDEITYNSILDGCARQRRLDEALRIFEEMRAAGITPSNYTLSIILKLLGRARRLNQAFQMVESFVQDYGVTPNIQVYTCLVQACCHNKQLPKALQLHDRSVREGCKLDEKFYSVLVKGCLHESAVIKAEEVVRCAYHLPGHQMVQTTGRPHGVDPACLQEVIDALGAERGHALASEIPRRGGRQNGFNNA